MEKIEKEIADDIARVARKLGTDSLSRDEYYNDETSKFSHYQIYEDGRDWTKVCKLAGVKPKTKEPVSNETYYKRLANAVNKLGRYPKTNEKKIFGLNYQKRRFPGGFKEFIKSAIDAGFVPNRYDDRAEEKVDSGIGEKQSDITNLIRNSIQKNKDLERPIPAIPISTKRTKWARTGLPGFPYAPQEEQGVLALFAILCAERILPWQILDLTAGKGIDATCFDENESKEIQVELKYLLSKGSWNHPVDDLDFVVCWENRWPDFPKPVIELSKLIKET